MHHKCRSPTVIPLYGVTKAHKGNGYAMVIKHEEHGDLMNYIRKFPKLTWTDKVKILIEISKALNSLHESNILHRDFHCKNLLVDDDNKVYIVDFGLCIPVDSEIGTSILFVILKFIFKNLHIY